MSIDATVEQLRSRLTAQADPAFAERMQRYFPRQIDGLGVSNAAVVAIANDYYRDRPEVTPETRLMTADDLLSRATHHEEVLLGFALLHKVAKGGLGVELLDRCETWLEEAVTNWAQCDDLCLKLLYPYFLGHLDLIPMTRPWVDSTSAWTRRAANVAVVKFVRRKVGREVFELPLTHVFDNCTRLMHDEDDYVQKGCGWLLKVAAQVHAEEVSAFLRSWHSEMRRDTFRYAVEKLDPASRAALMALSGG